MATVVNINDVLDGHVSLEVECVDRLSLNAHVAKLQVGQVAWFLHDHLGYMLPSPAGSRRSGIGSAATYAGSLRALGSPC